MLLLLLLLLCAHLASTKTTPSCFVFVHGGDRCAVSSFTINCKYGRRYGVSNDKIVILSQCFNGTPTVGIRMAGQARATTPALPAMPAYVHGDSNSKWCRLRLRTKAVRTYPEVLRIDPHFARVILEKSSRRSSEALNSRAWQTILVLMLWR